MAWRGTQAPAGPFLIKNKDGRRSMTTRMLALGVAGAAMLALGGCNKQDGNGSAPPNPQTSKAQKAAGTKTISAGLAPNSRFVAAAKAAGLDQTLAGPG